MPFRLHIGFDNSKRLLRRVYYFEYKGVRFKLIQNDPRKWSDVLLTVVPRTDPVSHERALAVAGEFLSALSWQNSARIDFRNLGGLGVRDPFRLRQATCQRFDLPHIRFGGLILGHDIERIPAIQTGDQRRALVLWREAMSCNKPLFSFLLYWQILEIDQRDPVGWVNKAHRKGLKWSDDLSRQIAELPLVGKSLGQYLLDDCRHAIAHLRRRPGKTTLKFDDLQETRRISISLNVVQRLAVHCIKSRLNLDEMMVLARQRPRRFPTYVAGASLRHGLYRSAYPARVGPQKHWGPAGYGRAIGPRRPPRRPS